MGVIEIRIPIDPFGVIVCDSITSDAQIEQAKALILKYRLVQESKPISQTNTVDKVLDNFNGKKLCPLCGKDLVNKSGTSKTTGKPYSFWGCSGFPACKHVSK